MTRDAAILREISIFRRDANIDETNVAEHLHHLLDMRTPGGAERNFDENERELDLHLGQLAPLTAAELEVVKDCFRSLRRLADAPD